MQPGPDVDVVVLLGTSWERLRTQGTRWRAVVRRWRDDPRVRSLAVVDYPGFRRRAVLGSRRPLAHVADSWLEDVPAIRAHVPLLQHRTPLDDIGWRRVARAIEPLLPGRAQHRLLVAATPLWTPVLRWLPAARRGFDAVDDWRGLAATRAFAGHIDRGYRVVSSLDSVTTVSDELTQRLARDYGIAAVTVANGVDLAAYAQPTAAPAGLPTSPFAVYVGVVEDRVDIEILAALVRRFPRLPVVVAGPARPPYDDRLRDAGVHWLGPVDVDLVPGLLSRAGVGLVPHRVTEFTASMNPMKVLEYLAAGLPVVATPVPGIQPSSRVRLATADEFPAAVDDALQLARLDRPDPAVADRDWSGVAACLLDLHLGTIDR